MTANLGITLMAIVRIGNLSARRFRRAHRGCRPSVLPLD